MRLINVETLELEEFLVGDVPVYAILSHRWGSAELTFKEMSKRRVDRSREGYLKLKASCEIAAKDHNLKHLWIDTCCIDKRSSAELSEAINSMYRWYQDAAVCIVYLRDFHHSITATEASSPPSSPPLQNVDDVAFKNSEWFSRAWTLQELLAPDKAYFYDRTWNWIGTKESLESVLVAATNIPASALRKDRAWNEYPIAQRMLWASQRQATREEDLAYSLLGLFDVNMPMLYGEGTKAFIRLQEEIIKTSCDRSFLLWGVGLGMSELLATSPAQFNDVPDHIQIGGVQSDTAFTLTNLGLDIELELTQNGNFRLYDHQIVRSGISYGDESYMLVLGIDVDSGHFEKKGVVKKKPDGWPGSVKREGAIHTTRLTLPRLPPVWYNQLWRPEDQPVPSLCAPPLSLSISPIGYRDYDSWYAWRPNSSRPTGQLFDFFPRCSHDILRVSHIRENGLQLWFDVFFDFNFHPCVFITNECTYEQNCFTRLGMGDAFETTGPFKSSDLGWKSAKGYEYAVAPARNGMVNGIICRSNYRHRLNLTIPRFFNKLNASKNSEGLDDLRGEDDLHVHESRFSLDCYGDGDWSVMVQEVDKNGRLILRDPGTVQ